MNHEPNVSKIEQQLAKKILQEAKMPSTLELTTNVAKQQRTNEFVRLGVHGILTMIISIFTPFFIKKKQHHIQRRRITYDK